MAIRYFEDISDGEHLHCQPVVMTKAAIIEFAREFDPQAFHIDEAAANHSIFKGVVASALHTLSACTRAVVEAQGEIAIISGLGMHAVRIFNPVRPGDILTVAAWWTDLKRSNSKPDRGLASIKCKVSNQRCEPVMTYGYRYLLACQDFERS